MEYRKKSKIALIITVMLIIAIMGSVFVLGALGIDFNLRKQSYYTVEFPYERISDISAENMTALILDKINNPNADAYININSQNISLNIDYTLKDLATTILVSEYKDGLLIYRPHQIHISTYDKVMTIYPQNYTFPSETDNRCCAFTVYWNALSFLPIDAISKTIKRDEPDFYSLHYTPNDWYENSSPEIKHVFYDMDGAIGEYRQSPSAIFNFSPMYQGKNDSNTFHGEGTTLLYYYNYRIISEDDSM